MTTRDIHTRIEGRAGRITLTRAKALNALTHGMCLEIEAALDAWAEDDAVALVVIDAEGDKAFCAGGGVAAMYRHGIDGDLAAPRNFWSDEYRMNAKIYNFPKPVVSLMQGYTMGGGVGVGGHCSHRVVCDSTRISMPECLIGLIPDVGGTLLLARAPGRMGEYLGVTAERMGPGDAIYCGFADHYVPSDRWPALIEELCRTGDRDAVGRAAEPAPEGRLAALRPDVDRHFTGDGIGDILNSLQAAGSAFSQDALAKMAGNSPLSTACTVELILRARMSDTIEDALGQEFRFTYRAVEEGDFLEGVRAALIDKDKSPKWQQATLDAVPPEKVSSMLAPLRAEALKL